jgi:serine/threonine-protein kinase HipA
VRSGQVKAPDGFGYWLLKFDGVTYSEHGSIMENPQGIGNVEYAYYQMAKACGINMAECRLLTEGDNHHFMTRRFDRTNDGEKMGIRRCSEIVDEVIDVVSHWRTIAQDCGVKDSHITEIENNLLLW